MRARTNDTGLVVTMTEQEASTLANALRVAAQAVHGQRWIQVYQQQTTCDKGHDLHNYDN